MRGFVPNPVLRVLLAISALIAVLLMSALGLGVAAADPEDPGNASEPDPSGETPTPSEPEPATGLPSATPPSIFDIPQTIATQLRDMFGKPLSLFGNGRVPGTLTIPETTESGAATGRKRDRPSAKKDEPTPDLTPPDPVAPVQQRTYSTVEVTLPFTPPISVPVPSIPVPGYETMRWTLNLTDPYAAYTSVGQTLNTVNSLLSDAYAPYDPFKPPAPPPEPEPAPSFRTMQEEPSIVDAEGTGAAIPLSSGSSGLPVLQAPVVVPQVRAASPRPITGTIPANVRVLGAGSAGVRAQELRGSVTQTGSVPTEQLPPAGSTSGSTSAMGSPTPRQGYPGYLRSARISQIATVALPGVAGLIAVTISGGMIGYRQANSGRYLRSDAARFLQ
jgi:hypothetical protein